MEALVLLETRPEDVSRVLLKVHEVLSDHWGDIDVQKWRESRISVTNLLSSDSHSWTVAEHFLLLISKGKLAELLLTLWTLH